MEAKNYVPKISRLLMLLGALATLTTGYAVHIDSSFSEPFAATQIQDNMEISDTSPYSTFLEDEVSSAVSATPKSKLDEWLSQSTETITFVHSLLLEPTIESSNPSSMQTSRWQDTSSLMSKESDSFITTTSVLSTRSGSISPTVSFASLSKETSSVPESVLHLEYPSTESPNIHSTDSELKTPPEPTPNTPQTPMTTTETIFWHVSNPDPNQAYRQERYFVSIKSDDCPKIRVNKFDHELSKALAALGVLNVSANIARTKCQTQLSINITATAPHSAIKLLEHSRRKNLTITVFNRTFKIVDIQSLDTFNNHTDASNATVPVVGAARKNPFNAYVAVGCCFGLVLLVCVTVCCMKCWSGREPNKRFSHLRSSHAPLSPEDYTLTPLPRPTSLYVDYYRNSFSADSASAGSVGSTSPVVEKVVQPFDKSIVPLEDFTLQGQGRRHSVESVDGMKRPTIETITNHALMLSRNSVTDSTEKLNGLRDNLRYAGGVTNPTYQRY